jgi:hypothetical protein
MTIWLLLLDVIDPAKARQIRFERWLRAENLKTYDELLKIWGKW